jgi:branched-chain amino acid transport system substrate-binding protein
VRDFSVNAPAFEITGSEPNVATVDIGYFGPAGRAHPVAGDMWCAAQMALNEANSAGGCRGKPFRLIHAWSDQPWGTGVRDVARLVYEQRAWALIGGIDGPTTHLAEQVAVKARVPLLSPVSTDKTVNLVNIPWVFSYAPQDHLSAPVLAAAVGKQAYAVIAGTGHDAHLFLVELRKSLAVVPVLQLEVDPQKADLASAVTETLAHRPAAVVLLGSARVSADLVRALRQAGFQGTVYGGPWMGQQHFLEQAGASAERVIFPLLYTPRDFDDRFAARCGRRPDYLAACTYDTVTHLVRSIRRSGLDRTKLRAALADAAAWQGVAGAYQWDKVNSNTREVGLGTIRGGEVVPLWGDIADRQ